MDFKYTLSVATIMKLEEPYVAEWVAFHKCIGIQHFYIYDNDKNSTIADILKPYIEEGLVDLIPQYGDVQMFPAYQDALFRSKFESKYLAFIDADEFIVTELDEPVFETVNKLFDKFTDWPFLQGKNPGALGINWNVFGTNGHIAKPEGLVIENYIRKGNTEANNHIKSIVNPRVVKRINNPHYAELPANYCTVSQKGSTIQGPFFPDGSVSPLKINHYFYKSEEEFRKRLFRKKADIQISEEALRKHIEYNLQQAYIYNEIVDKSALKFADKVKAELQNKGYVVS